MKKYKKNIIWVLLWTVINVLLSMTHQYIRSMPHSNNASSFLSILDGIADQISVFIVGPILGLVGTPIFLLIDYFLLREKIKNKHLLFMIRIAIIISVILIIFHIERVYF